MGQGYVYDKATPQTLGVIFSPQRNYYVYFNNKVNKYKFECLYVNVISYMYNTSEILKLKLKSLKLSLNLSLKLRRIMMARGQRKKAPGTKPMSSFLQKYYTGAY